MTAARVAPSAIRMPISDVRRLTEYDTTAKRPTIASARPSAPSVPSNAAPIWLGRNANASAFRIVCTSTEAVGSSCASTCATSRGVAPESRRSPGRRRGPRAADLRAARRPRRWRPADPRQAIGACCCARRRRSPQDSRPRSGPADECACQSDRTSGKCRRANSSLMTMTTGAPLLIVGAETRALSPGRSPTYRSSRRTDEVVLVVRLKSAGLALDRQLRAGRLTAPDGERRPERVARCLDARQTAQAAPRQHSATPSA